MCSSDLNLDKILSDVYQTGIIGKEFFTDKIALENNIVYTNIMRIYLNEIIMEKLKTPDSIFIKHTDEHDPEAQDIYLFKGLKVIGRCNNEKLGIVNSLMYEVVSFGKEYIVIKPVDSLETININTNDILKLLLPAYAFTTHKSQGKTLDNVTIHEWDLMSKSNIGPQIKYTACSRVKKSSEIGRAHV